MVDTFGELVHVERMDGEVPEELRTALLKAQTSLRERLPTSVNAAQLKNNPAGFVRSADGFKWFAEPGGIPIVADGQMIGAVGVTVGGAAGGDEDCAVAGLKAAFGTARRCRIISRRIRRGSGTARSGCALACQLKMQARTAKSGCARGRAPKSETAAGAARLPRYFTLTGIVIDLETPPPKATEQ